MISWEAAFERSGLCDGDHASSCFEAGWKTASIEAVKLTDALEQWKCPACGGCGNYLNKSNAGGQYEETTVPCTKCAGRGLHPVAIVALSARAAADGRE